VFVDGKLLTALSAGELLQARQKIGMIFQHFNLLMQRSALDNIVFPLSIAGVGKQAARARALELLEIVGMPEKANAFPAQLSGGQKQRVAIARAIATEPSVLLCDEATSALDPQSKRSVLSLIKEINATMGVSVVVITHEMAVVEEICSRVAIMDDSRIVETGSVESLFYNPLSQVAKRLLDANNGHSQSFRGNAKIRVHLERFAEPLVGAMAMACGAPARILESNTSETDGLVSGHMTLQLPDDERAAARMRTWLASRGVRFEEEST
jgi:D-methionine transport system ATP-binding protein